MTDQPLDHLLSEREKTHGDWSVQSHAAVAIKEALGLRYEHTLPPPISEALSHIAVKLARITSGNPFEPDHWKDIAGYARLAEMWITNTGADKKGLRDAESIREQAFGWIGPRRSDDPTR